jgi:hypothetical protein
MEIIDVDEELVMTMSSMEDLLVNTPIPGKNQPSETVL